MRRSPSTPQLDAAPTRPSFHLDASQGKPMSHLLSGSPHPGVVIFLKVGERVKKLLFVGNTIEELRKLCLERFTDLTRFDVNVPFQIMDKESRIQYELEDVRDLFPNCIVELRRLGLAEKRRAGIGTASIVKDMLVFALVGLPARGKSFIGRKVSRYLNWLGINTRVFNVGEYRRKKIGAGQDHQFFDPTNVDAAKARTHMAIAALDDMLNWLHKGGRVAIYDATNSTNDRRHFIRERCEQEGFKVVFIESLCEDKELVERNIRDTKLTSPDYINKKPEEAMADFRERIKHYESAYETITDNSLSYVKLVDVGRRVIINKIHSYIAARVVFFLMNLNITPRPIFLTRHGQSEFNAAGRIGGNSPLTDAGDQYARILAEHVEQLRQQYPNLVVWTSTLQRTIQTAQYIPLGKTQIKQLDEIAAGDCDGMTYDEIAEKMPEEFQQRAANKLRYRYPRGESYEDLIERLEPVIFELERLRNPVLIVAHQATLRCMYAYLADQPIEQVPHLPMPLHTLIRLIPTAYGTQESRIRLLDVNLTDG
jgi:broad specificity phosphatase PhoE/predicted kinase